MFPNRPYHAASLVATGVALVGLALVLLIIKFLMFMAEAAAGIIGLAGIVLIAIGVIIGRRYRNF